MRHVKNKNQIIRIIRDNIVRRGTPIYLSRWARLGWIEGLNVDGEGEYLFFTGLMYQMTPYIESMVSRLSRLNKSILLDIGSKLNRLIDISRLFSKVDGDRVRHAHQIIRSIYLLLVNSGVDIYYNPGLDVYAGTLLHDFGLEDDLSIYAYKVYRRLEEVGVDKVVTIDPHTTYMLKEVYPKYIDDYSLEVYPYIDLIKATNSNSHVDNKTDSIYVIHDPCYYARALKKSVIYRDILKGYGIKYVEPRFARLETYCCGGPIESLSPEFSANIASRRLEMLRETGADKVIVLCPICLANLRRAAGHQDYILDFSEILASYTGDKS